MDSISRYCLLAYLKANPDMTYEDIVEFIEGMQPMEVDGAGPDYQDIEPLGNLLPGIVYEYWPPGSMG